nr:hemagglutinin repeat-containing protein [Xanthomonas prunicola]
MSVERSETKQRSSTSKGSTLQAGGNVNLIATGGGEDSNILVRGSDIKAGNNLLLAADNNITLEAAQDTFEQHSTNKSKSAAIGVAITYGADGFAAGVTASASGSRGKADGTDVTQRNSHLSAGNTATIISGNDTTLKGAVLSANSVLADIGGDLNIESLQDTSTYASKDKAVGGSVTFGIGFSASASYSSNKVNGDFASVTEQSGIQAGDGGFDIRVGGNTDLKGGVIASTQAAVDAGANRLQTGTLTVSDITNTSSYEAKGISLSGGYAAGGSKDGAKTETQTPPTTNNGSNWSWQNQGSGAQGASAGYSSKSGSETSLTTSGISGGTLVITDQAGQQAKTGQSISDVLASLNRDVLTGDSANGLVKGWDGQKLQQQVSAGAEITATFGQQASKAVGDYASTKATQLRLQGKEDEAAKWDEGGEYRVAAHATIGLLGGGVQGALGSATAATAAPLLNELTKNLPDGVREAVGAGVAAGLGAAAGGSAGAATAFNADTNNRQLHPSEVKFLKSDEVVEKYIDYMAKNGLVLTEEEARVRLNRFAASKEDENWAALNGTDVLTESFLVKGSEGRYYTDSMGDRHAFFQSTDKEWKDPTVNLNALYGSRFDPSIKNYIEDIRSPDHGPTQKNKELQYLGTTLGYDAADKQASFGGDLTSIGKGMLLGIGSIAFSGYSDQIGPLDELALKNNYQLLLKDQGRWAEAGYVEGLDWATTQRLMWAGIAVGEAGGLVGGQLTGIIRNSMKNPRLNNLGSAAENIYTETKAIGEEFPNLAGVNPHYVEGAGPGVNTNCVSCVNAAQDRLSGKNINAVSDATKYSDMNGLLPSAPFGFEARSTPAAVVDQMLKEGNGAARPLIIEQPGKVMHVINVVNKNGTIFFIDTQLGKIVKLNPDVAVRLGRPPL